ncbi:E3 ubiquitin-protein ligase TRIM71-like [Patiria miniata]|uniref:Uncharacterized protein n=1 Tax=Patiria miniata TaxID=46514 RepID=A0A913ZTY8_PATMI|nr:E3 ubiquitin-protein ligase TRIM71-like [Patiria miniata]
MASNVTAQLVLEKISVDHLECSICTNRFRQPKLLDCLHSFCLQCLQELRQSQDPSGTKLTCPLCRHETMLKGSGVADLPNNFAFSALEEEVTMQDKLLEGQGSVIKCQACDEENQAISRCMDCDHFLCQECQKAHGRMTLMKSHKIFTLAQLRSGEIVYKSKLREEVPKCGKHPDQNLNVYCNSCEQVICTTCSILDHAKHSLTGLPEAVEKCKKKVTEMVQKSESKKTELSTTIEETSKSREELDTMFAKTQKKISKKAQQEIRKIQQEVAKIQKEELKLMKETERIYKDRVTTFEAAQANNRKEVTQTENKLEEVKQLMNQASCYEILELQQKLLHNFSELTGKQPQLLALDGSEVKVFNKQHQLLTQFYKSESDSQPTCLAADDSNLTAVGYKGKDEISLYNDGYLIRRLPAPMIGDYLTIYNNRLIMYTTGLNNRLMCVDIYGASVFSVDMKSNMEGVLHPGTVCCDSDGSTYVAVFLTGDILHYSPNGKYIGRVIQGCGHPGGMTFTSDGDLVVAAGESVKVYHRV